jgi:hypothetical protein
MRVPKNKLKENENGEGEGDKQIAIGTKPMFGNVYKHWVVKTKWVEK